MFYPFEMEQYLESLLGERDTLLREIEEQALKETIPIVTPMVGNFLNLLVHMSKAKRILEIGTAIGYSTIWLAHGAKETGGHVTTIDMNKDRLARAKENINRAGLSEQVTAIEGDARKVLKTLDSEFDFVFVDAAKGEYLEYLNLIYPLIEQRGLLVVDNVLFRGWVVPGSAFAPKYDRMVGGLRRFLEDLSLNPDFSTSVLPFGDGVSVSRRIGK
ncbi:putative O-methyltransferase [Desulfosporosinus orientis DSM 765]|uniref:tRNA 5-hydroxyuridine methyltransferase n=1 Tax=Desulfosporosinus orientis (strain ATCC 19365 / DSM 765 / NCIMB 8382 / VKM B-1628 / Singapore I) TaxID=768706 RepID=G7W9S2_DESOD|nr:O-methyltransferase [Desulfosporosinus orientis]AET70638.1 putative O-methyltransferase [Desulfosporosinus orientis DSM 765]